MQSCSLRGLDEVELQRMYMLLRQYRLGNWMERMAETIRVPRAWDFEHACLDLVLHLEHLSIYLAHRSHLRKVRLP